MKPEHYGLARRFSGPGTELGFSARRELARSADRITSVGDVARVAMNEVATNYMTAEQLAAQALTAAHCVAQGVPQTEVSQAYLNTMTQHFLQRMVTLTNLANDAIVRRTHESTR